jgi:multiple sugar transport system ATP-binding protein
MNLWPGTGRRADGATRVTTPMCSIELPQHRDVPDGSELLIGVRPHDLDLVPSGEGDGVGRVDIIEPLGPFTLIHLRVDGLPHELVRAIVPADAPIAVDDQTGFRARRDRLHVFDARSGRRLVDGPDLT